MRQQTASNMSTFAFIRHFGTPDITRNKRTDNIPHKYSQYGAITHTSA